VTKNVSLRFMSGSRDGETIQMSASGDPPAVTFGRLPTCGVCLSDDLEVSRCHARLFWKGGWWLEDLGSSNGSFLGEFQQGRRISEPAMISVGQIIVLGRTRFRLEPETAAGARFALQARAEQS
jgi:pSer/pThr/pTyr-binding forkhead associated (FHA) protein